MITLLCMYDLLNKPKGMKLNINLGLNTFLVTVANISSLVCVSQSLCLYYKFIIALDSDL